MTESIKTDTPVGDPIRVMVVDDSAVIRGLITRALESDSSIKVVASAANGEQAVTQVRRHPVEVVVLDIEMPVMDGLTAIPLLLKAKPNLKIIMASTLTLNNAEISMKALALGASDYIPKPTTARDITAPVDSAVDFKRALVEKVRSLGERARGLRYMRTTVAPALPLREEVTKMAPAAPGMTAAKPLHEFTLREAPMHRPEAIAIGSSTGGPQALFEVIRNLQGVKQPIFITQHMPPTFTTILAQHITRQCGVQCVEAQEGMIVEGGRIYLAPGDHHLVIKRFGNDNRVTLNMDPPENFCRPAVDPMLRSLVAIYGQNLLVCILTGMGSDGAKGAEVVVKAGGTMIAQDEATSVVWGMPGAVAMAGLASVVLPLKDIGPFLRQQAERN